MESVLKTLSSCNIVREAMVASLNRAALEAYWLGLNLVVSIELLLFSSKDCIGNNLRKCKVQNFLGLAHFTPLYSLRAPTSFKLLQAITMGLWYRAHPLALWGTANFSSLDTPPHITLAFPRLHMHDTTDSPIPFRTQSPPPQDTGQRVKVDNPVTMVNKLSESPRHSSMTSTMRQNASARCDLCMVV